LAIIGPNLRTNRRIEFIADHQSALSQKILDIPIAQRKPEGDSMSDDVRWKSVASVRRWAACQCQQQAFAAKQRQRDKAHLSVDMRLLVQNDIQQ
jgi:hypothetical protein